MEQENFTSEAYKECRKNHAAGMGVHDVVDGCNEYIHDRTKLHGLYCQACGCHRNFHMKVVLQWEDQDTRGAKMIMPISSRKQTIHPQIIDMEDGEGFFVNNGRAKAKQQPIVALAAGNNVMGKAKQQAKTPIVALAAGNNAMGKAKQQPKPTTNPQKPPGFTGELKSAMAAKQQPKPATKSPKVGFTDEQKSAMSKVAKFLGWQMQKITADGECRIQYLCKENGVTRKQFGDWMSYKRHIARRQGK